MSDTGGARPQDGGAAPLEDIQQDFDRMDSALAALDAGDLDRAEALEAELGASGPSGGSEAPQASEDGAARQLPPAARSD